MNALPELKEQSPNDNNNQITATKPLAVLCAVLGGDSIGNPDDLCRWDVAWQVLIFQL